MEGHVQGALRKELNNNINRIHERALRITYKDKSSTLQELLEKHNSLSIQHRNVPKLATEIYKVLHGFSPPILNDIFVPVSRPYNFHQGNFRQTLHKILYISWTKNMGTCNYHNL